MLHGGMSMNSGRIGSIGVENPYSDIFSQILSDTRNAYSTLGPILNPGIDPRTGRPYVTAPTVPYGINPLTGQPYPQQSTGMFSSMDTTTMLAIGAIGLGALFFFMKR